MFKLCSAASVALTTKSEQHMCARLDSRAEITRKNPIEPATIRPFMSLVLVLYPGNGSSCVARTN